MKRGGRVAGEEAVEAFERLVLLPLFAREKAVDVERQVVPLELGIVAKDATEKIARGGEVRDWSRAALIDRERVPFLEASDESFPLDIPTELAQAEERLGHLGSFLRRLTHEGGQQEDRIAAKGTDPDDVAVDPRVELGAELRLERFGDPRPFHFRAGAGARLGGRIAMGAPDDRLGGLLERPLGGRFDVGVGGASERTGRERRCDER